MSTFTNSPVTIGDNNVVKVVHKEKDNINWERLKEDCLMAIQKLPPKSEERQAVEAIFADAVKKDKRSLKETITKCAKALSSKLFYSVAGAVLTEIVKSFVL